MGLPMIVNEKTVDPATSRRRRSTSSRPRWARRSACSRARGAMRVPRSRFVPVKKTSDLLVLRSDAYVLGDGARIELAEGRAAAPLVELDDDHFKLLRRLRRALPGGRAVARRGRPARGGGRRHVRRATSSCAAAVTVAGPADASRTGRCWRAEPGRRGRTRRRFGLPRRFGPRRRRRRRVGRPHAILTARAGAGVDSAGKERSGRERAHHLPRDPGARAPRRRGARADIRRARHGRASRPWSPGSSCWRPGPVRACCSPSPSRCRSRPPRGCSVRWPSARSAPPRGAARAAAPRASSAASASCVARSSRPGRSSSTGRCGGRGARGPTRTSRRRPRASRWWSTTSTASRLAVRRADPWEVEL